MHKDGIQKLIMQHDAHKKGQTRTFTLDGRMQASSSTGESKNYVNDAIEKQKAQALKDGYNEGLARATAEWESKLSIVNQIIDSTEHLLKDVDGQIEQKLIEISIAIAKQIIRRELSIDSGQIVSTVKQALALIPGNEHEITVYIHPNDEACINDVFSQYIDSGRFTIFKDPGIEAGGCKVSTDFSLVDMTIDAQVAAIAVMCLGDQRSSGHT